jgi:methylmalonyl-CoA mutase
VALARAASTASASRFVGVNRFKPDGDRAIDLLRVDNGNVRTLQIDKLKLDGLRHAT